VIIGAVLSDALKCIDSSNSNFQLAASQLLNSGSEPVGHLPFFRNLDSAPRQVEPSRNNDPTDDLHYCTPVLVNSAGHFYPGNSACRQVTLCLQLGNSSDDINQKQNDDCSKKQPG
jgi:hypothetical protein